MIVRCPRIFNAVSQNKGPQKTVAAELTGEELHSRLDLRMHLYANDDIPAWPPWIIPDSCAVKARMSWASGACRERPGTSQHEVGFGLAPMHWHELLRHLPFLPVPFPVCQDGHRRTPRPSLYYHLPFVIYIRCTTHNVDNRWASPTAICVKTKG